jgi:hypothetical protein
MTAGPVAKSMPGSALHRIRKSWVRPVNGTGGCFAVLVGGALASVVVGPVLLGGVHPLTTSIKLRTHIGILCIGVRVIWWP